MELSGFFNMDCMEGMAQIPDKYFDLAIVDPPYGQFNDDKRGHQGGGHAKRYGYGKWDIAPNEDYFKELFRVSKNQIIWGGQLLHASADKVFRCLEKTDYIRGFHNGYVRICLVEFQSKFKVDRDRSAKPE